MFKGRIGIWISVLLCCSIITGLINWVPTWFQEYETTISVNIEKDNEFSEQISDKSIGDFKMRTRDSGADIIVSDSGENIDGYTKYENLLYSPIVMYTVADIYDHSEGFIKVSNNSSAFKADLYSILVGIENGKEWKDLGVSNKVARGPVTLYIPNEQNSYYEDVIELFYMTLNNGNIPSDDERDMLESRVNNIVSKCTKVVSITQSVYDEYKNSSTNHKVFIGPEYLYQRGSDNSMSRSYDDSFQIVYLTKTITLYADMLIKESLSEEAVNVNSFIDEIQGDGKFMDCTGWRVQNSTFDLASVGYVYIKEPK